MISDKIGDGVGPLGPSRRTPCFNITCNVVVLQQKHFLAGCRTKKTTKIGWSLLQKPHSWFMSDQILADNWKTPFCLHYGQNYWYFVTKIVLTYYEKKIVLVIEKGMFPTFDFNNMLIICFHEFCFCNGWKESFLF